MKQDKGRCGFQFNMVSSLHPELYEWKWSDSEKNEQKVDLLQVRYFNRFLEDGKQMT